MLRLRAVSGVVLLPALVLAAAVGVFSGLADAGADRTWLAWTTLQVLVVFTGLAAAAVVGSRRLRLDEGTLRFSSLTRRLHWQVEDIVAVTYEGHPSQSWHAHITLHHMDGGRLRLNVYLWHQGEMAALLKTVNMVNPRIRLSPAARGYLAVAR